ncbi:hypothetical protein GCM10009665_32300 [Kitasatospora nipponensis]|uniref:Alkaline shock response membrane anchor protein AmaP n=1 Tax=Kitasatospora nipponensis TaxID=258049 RepID=A0ABN1W7L2_9ACTN
MLSRTVVNRVLLALAGLVLLAGALLVLAGGLRLYAHTGVTPPGWWPLTSPSQPVLSTAARTRWRRHHWWWPVLLAALVVLVVLALCWLVAQLRRPSPTELRLSPPGARGLRVRLRGAALAGAVETAALARPEVAAVRVRLLGRDRGLRVRAALRLVPGSDVPAAVAAFHAGPLAQASATLARGEALPADLRLRVDRTPPPPRHPERAARGRRARRRVL